MDTITTELVESKHKRDPRGRKYTSASEREQMLASFAQSGLTQRAFAQREGIKFSTFVSWVQGRRRASQSGCSERSEGLGFVEASLPGLFGTLEVSLPDGIRVRGGNARELAALVKALRS